MNPRELAAVFARRREQWREHATAAESDLLLALERRDDANARELHERVRARLERRAELGGPPPRKERRSRSFILRVTDALRIRLAFDPTPTSVETSAAEQRARLDILESETRERYAAPPRTGPVEAVPAPEPGERQPTAFEAWRDGGSRARTPLSPRAWVSRKSRSTSTFDWDAWTP